METVRIQNGATEKIVALFYDSSDGVLAGETITISIYRESDGYWYTGAAWQSGYTTITGDMTEKAQGYYEYDFDTSGLSDDTYHIRAVCSNADCVVPVQTGEIKVGGYVDNIDASIASRSSHGDPDPSGYIDAAISTRSTVTTAEVNTEIDTALAEYDGPTRAELTSDKTEIIEEIDANETKIDALNDLSAAEVNTEVDTALAEYDGPTRAELTSDKDGIIGVVEANETKIDAIDVLVSRVLGLVHENVYIDTAVYDDNGNLTSARLRTYSVAGSVGTGSDVLATYTVTAVGDGAGKFTTWKMVKE